MVTIYAFMLQHNFKLDVHVIYISICLSGHTLLYKKQYKTSPHRIHKTAFQIMKILNPLLTSFSISKSRTTLSWFSLFITSNSRFWTLIGRMRLSGLKHFTALLSPVFYSIMEMYVIVLQCFLHRKEKGHRIVIFRGYVL